MCFVVSQVMLTPSNQLIDPKSEILKHSVSCLSIKKLAVLGESTIMVKSSVAAATIVNFWSSNLKNTASSATETE